MQKSYRPKKIENSILKAREDSVFVSKKDETLSFWVVYWKLNSPTQWNFFSSPSLWTDGYSVILVEQVVFQHLMPAVDTDKRKMNAVPEV